MDCGRRTPGGAHACAAAVDEHRVVQLPILWTALLHCTSDILHIAMTMGKNKCLTKMLGMDRLSFRYSPKIAVDLRCIAFSSWLLENSF